MMTSLNRIARGMAWMAVAGLIFVPTACDTLSSPLDVEPASRIPAQPFRSPANAIALSDGGIADFECAFGSYTVESGLVGEELMYAQQTASRTPYDRRNTTKDDSDYAVNACDNNLGVYTPLQVARQSNETLLTLLNTWTDARGLGQSHFVS